MFLYFEDNAGVIVNNKGEMKGEPGDGVGGEKDKRTQDSPQRVGFGLGNAALNHL